jgi:hypothetical protein
MVSKQVVQGGSEFGAEAKEFGGHQITQEVLVRGLPFRNKAGTGKPIIIWGPKNRIRPQCRVTTALWAPGADSGQRTKTEIVGQNSDRKMTAAHAPWDLPAMILANEKCLLLDCLGQSASVLRDSAVYWHK